MDDIKVTLDLRAYKEQPGCFESVSEFKDERLRYNYVEPINNNAEDISHKIEHMYFLAMVRFLNDYLAKHPGVYDKNNFPYVLLSREEYNRMKFQIETSM